MMIAVESPILAAAVLPVIAWAAWLARTRPTRPRRALWMALAAMQVAVAGVTLYVSRPPRVAVLVDVSPSTRGAAFRDAKSVEARLTPLLAGRPYTLRYFADGLLTTNVKPAVERTRLDVPADAEAVVLLSDGRLTAPPSLPPTYPVIDPMLDRPADARVRGVVTGENGELAADVVSAGLGRPLRAGAVSTAVAAGPAVVALPRGTTGRVGFAAGDAWPENDAVDVIPNDRPARRLAAGVDLPGFERIDADALPAVAGRADVVTLAVATDSPVPPAVASFVRDAGGTLLLVGPPGAADAAGRQLSPLSAEPPAGPQAWTILLDSSGSMAAGDGPGGTRWRQAVAAARAAAGRLPDDARVTVQAFARGVRTVIDNATPAGAIGRLDGDAGVSPGGPTGLRAALEAAAKNAGPGRLLLITDGDADLGDIGSLSRSLVSAKVAVDAVSAGATPDLAALCRATGGRVAERVAATDWATALGGLAGRAEPVVGDATAAGQSAWRGRAFRVARRWPAFAKADATVLAAVDRQAVAAVWRAGLGRVVAVAADVPGDALSAAMTAVERTPVDPRFAVVWDEAGGRVRVTAGDDRGPMNGVTIDLRLGKTTIRFDVVGPGQYEAALPRPATATIGVVTAGDAVVARRSVAGRAAAEFDAVGNDVAALTRLAERTGGAVIGPGDTWPIPFKPIQVAYPLRPAATRVAAGLMLVTVFLFRRR